MINELNVPEHIPAELVRQLNRNFLEAQTDVWIERLYEFLNGQPALHRLLSNIPVIRLEDGKHVVAKRDGHISAFLPTGAPTGFPTVRKSVCTSEAARDFLVTLGLKEPDLVDDIIANVLPKYRDERTDSVGDTEYAEDISRILMAFDTDSQTQRSRLINALAESRFVKSVSAPDSSKSYMEPGRVYMATERLTRLLSGVKGIFFADNSQTCLRGDEVRRVLEASGATRGLKRITVPASFTTDQKKSMRIESGGEDFTSEDPIHDATLKGLEEFLLLLSTLDACAQNARAKLLWEALHELEIRYGPGVFSCTYSWFYYHRRSAEFDAAFVKRLREARWVPDIDGTMRRPEFVSFEALGWERHPLLESIIRFKPPEIDVLASKFGIEPGMIELLREAGIQTEESLRQRLGLDAPDTSGQPEPGEDNHREPGAEADQAARSGQSSDAGSATSNGNAGTDKQPTGTANAGAFISYVAVQSQDEESDPDAFTHEKRMALEARAIEFILESEPGWQRTPSNNPGYDLFRPDGQGRTIFCEVKAMTSTLDGHPVGMSRTQFDHAREHGESFWLYVVEHAGSSGDMRIVRIQDPAGKAQTFTYDSGWRAIDRTPAWLST